MGRSQLQKTISSTWKDMPKKKRKTFKSTPSHTVMNHRFYTGVDG